MNTIPNPPAEPAYLTTPIYYASGSPHIGHAYTATLADCFRRARQLECAPTLLVTGTDEHGDKIARKASAGDESVATLIDRHSQHFADLWDALDIPVDRFVRTTDADHEAVVQAFWQRLVAAGTIYLGHYEGNYCVDCEQFVNEGDTCPIHQRPLEVLSEPGYFFRLSSFQQRLIDHIEAHPEFILPAQRRNEVLAFLRGEPLRDLSVSRRAGSWGIPVPGDPAHVIYVWVDALVSYLSALGPLDSAATARWWPGVTHFIGKDILLFHAVYWPALLWAAGLPAPRHLIVNGWLTVDGRKIAKSDPATVVDPHAVAGEVGAAGLKFYLLRAVQLGGDLDYRNEGIRTVLNTELANGFGNLVSRFVKLYERRAPNGLASPASRSGLAEDLHGRAQIVRAHLAAFELGPAINLFSQMVRDLNATFQQAEPWRSDEAEAAAFLVGFHECLGILTVVAWCFVPELADAARLQLGLSGLSGWADVDFQPVRREVRPGAAVYRRIV